MEEVNRNTYEYLINQLFSDDFFHTDFETASSSNFLPEESIQAQCIQDENGMNHKSDAKNVKSGKISANLQPERRPWLKEKPPGDQLNTGDEVSVQKPKLQFPTRKKDKKEQDSGDRTVYQKVMEEVANKTHEAFLKHYGDDSVHVRFQQLWKSKMKSKKAKLGRFAGKLPLAAATASNGLNPPYERAEECGWSGSFSKGKAPQLFQSWEAYQDENGRVSKSAEYKLQKLGFYKKQQSNSPWFANAGFEGPIPKKIKLRNPAKKQELHQPWLKQPPFDNQNNAGKSFLVS